MSNTARALVLVLISIVAACSSSTPDDATAAGGAQAFETAADGNGPPELHQVKDGLYRGGHPDRAALEYLKSLGVTTVLSLQQPDGSVIEGDKASEVAAEESDAADLGLRYVSVPMTSWASDSAYDDAWAQIAPMLKSPAGLYVHCQHGHDRTGVVIALERVFLEGWSADAAHQEMLDLGHSTLLVKIDRYFWSKTGGTNDD